MNTNEEIMYIDAHCHLFDLKQYFPNLKDELKNSNTIAVSSSTDLEEFKYNEELSKKINIDSQRIYLSFAIHPQMGQGDVSVLERLASEKKISAIGECGFDLYSDEYKATEKWQDEIFLKHLEIAIKFGLPVILHARRAMHKIFSYTDKLKKCKAVIFHSWPGTYEEGQSLFRRGVNAYFSFGNTILQGHKQQARSCAMLPLERILTETDAPYQPKKGVLYSSWNDLPAIIEEISNLKKIKPQEAEKQIEKNFIIDNI